MESLRLQTYIARCGIASRRKAEEIILDGKVLVNGVVVTDMGTKVTVTDLVEVDGTKICLEEKKVYILLNKPVEFITTVKDQFGRPTVLELIKNVQERIFPVGRLDYDTSGLLILTNDGDFTYRLTHPKHQISKVYLAKVSGIPSLDVINQFEKGLEIEDYVTSPAKLKIISQGDKFSVVEVTIYEGKNRQVRKMLSSVGHEVITLKRVAIGELLLGELKEGEWRYLGEKEVVELVATDIGLI